MTDKPKTSEEYDRFTVLVDQVIAVPRSEVLKREEDTAPKRREKKSDQQ